MKAVAVVDLQFGSTGKGLIASKLSLEGYNGRLFDAAVTNWGPNAGHTAVYEDGEKVVRTMLANSVFRGSVRKVFIGPGSMVNISALLAEVKDTYDRTNRDFSVYVHEHAAVVTEAARASETVHNRIGSTQKGAGAAAINKMMRDNEVPCLAKHFKHEIDHCVGEFLSATVRVVSHYEYMMMLMACDFVLMEGCQGYSLGYSSGFWPYVTSRECTTTQLAADTLVPHNCITAVIGTARTFPIRVANRYQNGAMVGFSGPGYHDQSETSFEDIGVPTEYTTVTLLPRRVFTYSPTQVAQACVANGVTDVFLNFCNYLIFGQSDVVRIIRDTHRATEALYPGFKPYFRWLGYGPKPTDVLTYWSQENNNDRT